MILSLGDVISLATVFAGRSDFSTSEVSRLANIALTEVTNRVYHKAKEFAAVSNLTGTGNERTVDLPSDYDGVLGVEFYSTSTNTLGVNVLGDRTELTMVPRTLIDSSSSISGDPTRYTIYADFLELDPIPDSRGSLVMRYLAKQLPLVVSTETPFLDERWHPGWLNKTEELVHRARSNHAGAADAERRYVNFMTSTPNDRAMDQMAAKGLGLWVRKS
jgi:hypothetical protein